MLIAAWEHLIDAKDDDDNERLFQLTDVMCREVASSQWELMK
jgi:hypothetical protein